MECIVPGIKRMSPSCLLHVVGRNILPSRAPCLLKFVGGRKERAPPAPTPCIPCAPTCLTSFQVLCLRTGTRSGKNTISSITGGKKRPLPRRNVRVDARTIQRHGQRGSHRITSWAVKYALRHVPRDCLSNPTSDVEHQPQP